MSDANRPGRINYTILVHPFFSTKHGDENHLFLISNVIGFSAKHFLIHVHGLYKVQHGILLARFFYLFLTCDGSVVGQFY